MVMIRHVSSGFITYIVLKECSPLGLFKYTACQNPYDLNYCYARKSTFDKLSIPQVRNPAIAAISYPVSTRLRWVGSELTSPAIDGTNNLGEIVHRPPRRRREVRRRF